MHKEINYSRNKKVSYKDIKGHTEILKYKYNIYHQT